MIFHPAFISILGLAFVPFLLLKHGLASSYALGSLICLTGLWLLGRLYQLHTSSMVLVGTIQAEYLILIGWVLLLVGQWLGLSIANAHKFMGSGFLATYFLYLATQFSSMALPSIERLQMYAKVFLSVHLLILLIYMISGVLYIYPEPSHLALAVIPWFTLLFMSVNSWHKKLLFGILLLFAVFSKNTTLVIYMLLALIWVRPPIYLIAAVLIYIIFFNEQQLLERLSLNKAIFPCHTVIGIAQDGYLPAGCPVFVSTSTLVWLKGWHLAYLNFLESSAWGIGFQQLGYTGAYSMISESIRSWTIGAVDLNIYDGASLAAKMLSEMGIWGLIFRVYTTLVFARYLYVVSRPHFFWVAAFIGGLFELYIRGYGYFTVNFVAYLAASIYFHRQLFVCKKQEK